ncbi:sigma factor-like helix-turn-helix DNA-binding protein [Niastella populi]|uniref:RNA polymerase sigma factor 70 region 4 type 2 domain-containing protein n=1 Tax=Niastella populi TaxID=550983 RepID=A0A1V9FV93_9BACT|nr:sigma factor-like helix-turn-helix DNA-binding protein [Niastella populi]OQP62241.1 hypothetical protein A4R26_18380 [Niastella populi]
MNDAQLISWIDQHEKAGETQFIILIDLHQPIIGKVCRLYKNSKDDQETLFREIVFRLWQSAAAGNDKLQLSDCIYQVMLSTAISSNIINASKRLGHKTEKLPHAGIGDQMMRAIRELADDDKAILLLYLEELPYPRIAAITGISETILGVKLNRIKKKVQQQITIPGEQYILKSIWRNIKTDVKSETELRSIINEPGSPVFGILNNILPSHPFGKIPAANTDLRRSLEDQLAKIRTYARASITSRVIALACLLVLGRFVFTDNMTMRWVMGAALLFLAIHVVALSVTWAKRARQMKCTINHLRAQREIRKSYK